jgi:hypothetical protein
MENIFAGLPNTSALVHYRLCHRRIEVAHPCNKHHSSHCPMDGTLQTWMDSGHLPSLVCSSFQRTRVNLLSVAHRHNSHLRLQAKVLSTTVLLYVMRMLGPFLRALRSRPHMKPTTLTRRVARSCMGSSTYEDQQQRLSHCLVTIIP